MGRMKLKRVNVEKFYRLFYPQPTFIIVSGEEGEVGALTATWVVPLSFMPPYAGVLISPERYTYKVLKLSKFFSINVLDFKYAEQASFIGNVSKRFLKDKLERSGLHFERIEGTYFVKEASGVIICERERTYEIGDHDLFVGKVKSVYATEVFRDLWDLGSFKPLLYLGSKPGRDYRITRIFQTVGEEVEVKEPELPEFFNRFKKHHEILEVAKRLGVSRFEEISKVVNLPVEDVKAILEEMKRQGRI